jgi:hypothetical protein
MPAWNVVLRVGLVMVLAALLPGAGCVVSVDPLDGGGLPGGQNYTTTVTVTHGGTDANKIKIRVNNNTGSTLDPEIYISDQAIVDAAELFIAERKYTTFGVGNRGLLGNYDDDEFTLDCTAVRVLGSKGGLFGDDLENPDGVGQQRILALDAGFSCGDTITFTFSR